MIIMKNVKSIIIVVTSSLLVIINLSCKKEAGITNNDSIADSLKTPSLLNISDSVYILNDTTVIFTSKIKTNGLPTTYYIEYDTSRYLLSKTTKPKNIVPDSNIIILSDTVSHLMSNTNYFYRMIFISIKDTAASATKSFRIINEILHPTIIMDTVLSITATSVVLSAKINLWGIKSKYYFEFGTSKEYKNKTIEKNIDPNSFEVEVRDSVFNLMAGTLYHYRLVISNDNDITLGTDKTFLTLNVPKVTLGQVKDITTNSATLSAWVNPKGKNVAYYFEFGETITYGNKTSEVAINASQYDMIAVAMIDHLRYGTQYHWRVHCRFDNEEVWSNDGVFTTINIINPVEFSYPLIIGTTLIYDYRLTWEGGISGSTPPSEQRKGIRIWEIKSKSVSSDSITTYNILCTANDTVLKRIEFNMPPDTTYYSELIPFTIVFTKDLIYVGFDKIVKFAKGNRSSPIVPIPRYVASGTTTVQLGDVLYSNGVGLKTYRAGFFSNTGGYAETLILR